MKLLDDLSVPFKLWGLTVALLVGLIATSFVTQGMLAQASADELAQVQDFDARIADSLQWRRLTETNIQRVIAMAISNDSMIAHNFERKIQEGITATAELQKRVGERSTSEADKRQLVEVSQHRARILAAIDKSKKVGRSGDEVQAQAFVDTELNPAVDAYIASLDLFGNLQVTQRADALAQAEEAKHRQIEIEFVLIALVAVLGLVFAAVVVRSISGPLKQAVEVSTAIAAGDLTTDVSSQRRDELGQMLRSMGQMVQRLRTTVTEVRAGVDAVSTASSQIEIGNFNLSQRTEEQAGSLQQTSASMEQLTSTVRQNAESALEVSRLATDASEAAMQGGEAMRKVVETMAGIRSGAHRIAEIATVIDGIAFQTNLLALNAAVEAARAGPQGRGFAVVAGEVRTLARRSAVAAKDIKALIDSSVADAIAGSERAQRTEAVIDKIVQQVQSVNSLIHDISTASREQAQGVAEVGVAISQLDTMTQQNAALVEESTAATESMAEMSVKLSNTMSAFRLAR